VVASARLCRNPDTGSAGGVFESPEFVDYGGDDDSPEVIEAARRPSKDWAVREELATSLDVCPVEEHLGGHPHRLPRLRALV
jgi:hypothetical protein